MLGLANHGVGEQDLHRGGVNAHDARVIVIVELEDPVDVISRRNTSGPCVKHVNACERIGGDDDVGTASEASPRFARFLARCRVDERDGVDEIIK